MYCYSAHSHMPRLHGPAIEDLLEGDLEMERDKEKKFDHNKGLASIFEDFREF